MRAHTDTLAHRHTLTHTRTLGMKYKCIVISDKDETLTTKTTTGER